MTRSTDVADTAEHPDVAVPQERGYGWRSRLLGDYGIMMVVLVMGVVLTILQPEYFLSAQNLTNIIRQIGMNALLALGLYLVILTAGIDLSVGSVMALSIILLALAGTTVCILEPSSSNGWCVNLYC
jgi:ribose/xylose/arabinose/galactoside ABC-type transport system permease subunit